MHAFRVEWSMALERLPLLLGVQLLFLQSWGFPPLCPAEEQDSRGWTRIRLCVLPLLTFYLSDLGEVTSSFWTTSLSANGDSNECGED
jgi:hypothetical protein